MKRLKFTLIIIGLLGSRLGLAANFEFISAEKRAELTQQFANAHAPTRAELQKIQKTWTCDMYGVRSTLQVKRDVNLYSFRGKSDVLKNSGSLPVQDYALGNHGLQGKFNALSDLVKISENGSLISELTNQGAEPMVIAYSICN